MGSEQEGCSLKKINSNKECSKNSSPIQFLIRFWVHMPSNFYFEKDVFLIYGTCDTGGCEGGAADGEDNKEGAWGKSFLWKIK